ncbi:hypothetical protein E1B28_007878 [Marasmius oreades]|uniref:Uncharacterized protein n=1 Tax=Marasmius oreades TaxID=181124 RepID=A0A9P7S2L6_9AGAR|nr:uncharacterized protein E1B28_007878 [Marasmius oreades]KAG7094274.1 hypothetical protein E1B28_007878 [Marasmius oreades]
MLAKALAPMTSLNLPRHGQISFSHFYTPLITPTLLSSFQLCKTVDQTRKRERLVVHSRADTRTILTYVHSGKQRPIAPPSGSEWRPDLAPIAHLLPKIPKRTGATPHQYQNASAASIHGPVFDGDTVPKLKRDVQKEEWKTRVKNNLTGLKFKKKEFTPKSKQSKENGSGEHGKVFDAYFRRKGNDKTTRTIDYANKRILLGTSKSNANATTTKVKTQRRIRFAEPEVRPFSDESLDLPL